MFDQQTNGKRRSPQETLHYEVVGIGGMEMLVG